MTTIAIRDGIVAADRLITNQSSRVGYKPKIERVGDRIISAVGAASIAERFFEWVRGGCEGPCPPTALKDTDDDTFSITGIIVSRERIETYVEGGMQWCEHGIIAFGSGGDAARGAMHAGADAIEAVRIASEVDLYTGGGIDWLRLHDSAG